MSDWSEGDLLPVISLDLTLRRAIQSVAGTRDYYPVHHDEQAAKESGAEGIFFNTMFLQGFVGRAICEWFGNDAFPRRVVIAMYGSNYVGRTLTAAGVVSRIRDENERHLVDVDVTLATEDGHTTEVNVSVQLPPETAS